MRSSSGFSDGLAGCKLAATPNCSLRDCSIWRMATRMSKRADGFCAPGFPGAMPAYVEHPVNWRNLDGFIERHPSRRQATVLLPRKLPRIVVQTSETVRVGGVSHTGHGVPRMDTVSRTGQSRPHKQNTQEGGSRAHARARSGTPIEAMSQAERISLERRLGQIQTELAEACRKKKVLRGVSPVRGCACVAVRGVSPCICAELGLTDNREHGFKSGCRVEHASSMRAPSIMCCAAAIGGKQSSLTMRIGKAFWRL